MFNQEGFYYHDPMYNSAGYKKGATSKVERISRSFLLRDPDNHKNVFVVSVNKSGIYTIYEGEEELLAAGYKKKGDY